MNAAIRSRSRAVVLLLVLGGATLALAAPAWLRTTVSTALEPQVAVEVTGTTAAPAVSAAAFVVIAGALAATLGGRVARRVALVVAAAAGLVVLISTAGVLADVEGPAVLAAGDAAGVTELTSAVEVAAYPWVVVVVGLLTVVVAVLALVGSGAWAAAGGRHERADATGGGPVVPDAAEEPDPQADWDALSRGTDPTTDR